MKMGDGGFRPAYNVQLSVDVKSRAVLGVDVSNSGSDAGQDEPMRRRVEAVTGIAVKEHLMDGGYAQHQTMTTAHKDGVTARLSLSYMGVHHAFTTRNTHAAAKSVAVRLVDGPFSKLEGNWHFHALGRPGSDQTACKIEFDLAYAFANAALEAVVSPVFDRVANTLVDSFVRRAEAVYGPR